MTTFNSVDADGYRGTFGVGSFVAKWAKLTERVDLHLNASRVFPPTIRKPESVAYWHDEAPDIKDIKKVSHKLDEIKYGKVFIAPATQGDTVDVDAVIKKEAGDSLTADAIITTCTDGFTTNEPLLSGGEPTPEVHGETYSSGSKHESLTSYDRSLPALAVCTCGATTVVEWSDVPIPIDDTETFLTVPHWRPSTIGWALGHEPRHLLGDAFVTARGVTHACAGIIPFEALHKLAAEPLCDTIWLAVQGSWTNFDLASPQPRMSTFGTGDDVALPRIFQWLKGYVSGTEYEMVPGVVYPQSIFARILYQRIWNNVVTIKGGLPEPQDKITNRGIVLFEEAMNIISARCAGHIVSSSQAVTSALDAFLDTETWIKKTGGKEDLPVAIAAIASTGSMFPLHYLGGSGTTPVVPPGAKVFADAYTGGQINGLLGKSGVDYISDAGKELIAGITEGLTQKDDAQEVTLEAPPDAEVLHGVELATIIIALPDGRTVYGQPVSFGLDFETESKTEREIETIIATGGRIKVSSEAMFPPGSLKFTTDIAEAHNALAAHLHQGDGQEQDAGVDEWDQLEIEV